jgi:hypothetical protein
MSEEKVNLLNTMLRQSLFQQAVLFYDTQLYKITARMERENKVIPKSGIFHARIHEINVNLSCSQNNR